MNPVLALGIALLIVAGASDARAEDLHCSKVKDPQAKVKYVADLRGIRAEKGCTIKTPATIVCVPGTTTDVAPVPPGSTSNRTSKGFACYQTRCPKKKGQPAPSSVRVYDQFGDRLVTPKPPNLLCVPVDTPIFSCGDGPYPQCGGTCPDGQVCVGTQSLSGTIAVCTGTSSCACVNPEVACNGAPCPSRLCRSVTCPIPISGCVDCNRPGGPCADDQDCCFGHCLTSRGAVPDGICVDP